MATATDNSELGQISQMLAASNGGEELSGAVATPASTVETPPSAAVAPVESQPEIEVSRQQSPAGVTTPAATAEIVPASTEDDQPTVGTPTDALSAAMAKIEELSAQLVSYQQSQADGRVSEPQTAPTNFVTQEDIDEGVFATPEKMNAILAKVAAQAAEDALRRATAVTEQVVRRSTQTTMLVEKFYNANKDLQPYKSTVARIANGLIAQNPDFAARLDLLLPEAAKQARLELSSIIKEVRGAQPTQPAAAPVAPRIPSATQRAVAPDPKGLRAQIDSMLTANRVDVGELLEQ